MRARRIGLRIEHLELNIGQIPGGLRARFCQVIFARALSQMFPARNWHLRCQLEPLILLGEMESEQPALECLSG